MSSNMHHDERLDQATRARLAKLSAMPVDASRLEAKLRAELEPPAKGSLRLAPLWSRLGAVAAAVVLAASVFFVTLGTESPARAAPAEMLQVHQSIVSGQMRMSAAGIDALRRVLASPWEGQRTMDKLPADVAHACCLRKVAGKNVVGVMLDHEGVTVTAVVANRDEMRPGEGETVQRGLRRYVVSQPQGISMVMTEHGGRLLCLMGPVPSESLIDLAEAALAEP